VRVNCTTGKRKKERKTERKKGVGLVDRITTSTNILLQVKATDEKPQLAKVLASFGELSFGTEKTTENTLENECVSMWGLEDLKICVCLRVKSIDKDSESKHYAIKISFK